MADVGAESMFGGTMFRREMIPREISRVLVLNLSGKASGAPAPPRIRLPLTPPSLLSRRTPSYFSVSVLEIGGGKLTGGEKSATRPDAEYLTIIKNLANSRDDSSRHNAKTALQEFLNRDLICSPLTKRRFAERYRTGDASLHIHGRASINPDIGNRVEFFAVLNSSNAPITSK